jgi:heme/copper-type cytochrome/quinol oxidase subunit 2
MLGTTIKILLTIIIIIIVIIIIFFVVTFMQGIYNYMPETNRVSSISITAVLYLQCVLHVCFFSHEICCVFLH